MTPWQRFLPRARIGTRIVVAVTVAMALVLLGTGAFVYWRVQVALNRQVDQDLVALAEIAERDVTTGTPLPSETPGQTVQLYDARGRLLQRTDQTIRPLLGARQVARALAGVDVDLDRGSMLPPSPHPYRLTAFPVRSADGTRVVVVAAISRRKHDEALRELLLQLALSDVLAIVAAAFVGYGVTRAALGPVERYRRAVVEGGGDPSRRLPVDESRGDELSRLGHTFNALLDRIEEAHVRERGYLADASHELRSPLALLAAEIEWARHRRRTPEQLDEVLDSIGSQVARLVELSNALLDLEELHTSGEGPRRAPVRLDELVEAAVTDHRDAAAAQGRVIGVHAEPETVEVDARWVGLALSNLIGNALKHGCGRVDVAAAVHDGRVVLDVRDEGPGIPATLGERAFDRFTRADESRTTRGNGLGLALVRAVAEAHDGDAVLVDGRVVLVLRCERGSFPG
jgi:two-component system, OmpR family, sensor kinase